MSLEDGRGRERRSGKGERRKEIRMGRALDEGKGGWKGR